MNESILRNIFIGFIVFMAGILSVMGILSVIQDNDSSFIDDTTQLIAFNNSFNKYSEMQEEYNRTNSLLLDAIQDPEQSFIANLWNVGWQLLRQIPSILLFGLSSIMGISTVFTVPGWLPALLVTALTITIVFVLISVIFQRDV